VNALLPLLLSVPMCLPCVAQAPSATPQDPPTLDPNAPRQPIEGLDVWAVDRLQDALDRLR
jgi:hypothetical protein